MEYVHCAYSESRLILNFTIDENEIQYDELMMMLRGDKSVLHLFHHKFSSYETPRTAYRPTYFNFSIAVSQYSCPANRFNAAMIVFLAATNSVVSVTSTSKISAVLAQTRIFKSKMNIVYFKIF